MLSKFAMLLMVITLSGQVGKETPPPAYEDAEAYEVYAAVLALEKPPSGFPLIRDTTAPFDACLDTRSDKLVDSAIEDYKKANKSLWQLGYHFTIKQPYKLLSAKEADALLQPDRTTGARPLAPGNGIHRFSAVGFSADKTIAFVEMDVICGGLCGHGGPFMLQKQSGKWIRYSPPAVRNPDGSWAVATSCAWFY